jgi:SAM-dependent methyltransferase
MASLFKGEAISGLDIRDVSAAGRTQLPPVAAAEDDVDQLQLWNEYHRKYWNSEERVKPTPPALLLADSLSRGQRILELGCGSGRDAVFLQGRGHSVTATDFSEFAIDANISFHEASGVVFSVQDLRTPLTFFDADFDAVYARLSLHYFPDGITRDIFREIHRVLVKETRSAPSSSAAKVRSDTSSARSTPKTFSPVKGSSPLTVSRSATS